jgi:hypothetical protein
MATSAGATRAADQITFAHNSERQFARLLDFYQVEWEYEPTAFPIEWDAVGRPVQQFRPDFYLPRFRLYIEITTLNQRLVTKKNRKVRRLRELYPDVRIKVLYQRDYLSLLAKYGLEPPSQLAAPPDTGSGTGAAGSRSDPAEAPAPVATGPRGDRGDRVGDRAARPAQPDRSGSAEPTEPGQSRPAERAQPGAGEVERGVSRSRRAGGPAEHDRGGAAGRAQPGSGGAVERARAAGRPRVVHEGPGVAAPLPADPELVRLAQVPLPAELARRRGMTRARRAG